MNSRRCIFIAVNLVFCACHFKAPNISEQKYLMEKGAFPGGLPDWVAQPTGAGNGVFAGGLIPQTFTQSTREQPNTGVPTANESGSSFGTFQTPDALKEKEQLKDEARPDSPLHRISKICPTIEKETNSALLTTDLRQRIRSYESLVVRCPDSWDLWLWLGKDYAKLGDNVRAGRCFEKVLVFNPTNVDAQQLVNENRKKLNEQKAIPQKKKPYLPAVN